MRQGLGYGGSSPRRMAWPGRSVTNDDRDASDFRARFPIARPPYLRTLGWERAGFADAGAEGVADAAGIDESKEGISRTAHR